MHVQESGIKKFLLESDRSICYEIGASVRLQQEHIQDNRMGGNRVGLGQRGHQTV